MASSVLPTEEINALLCHEFVLLKVDIDKPTKGVQKFLDAVKGQVLPFWAYVTPDGTFISGSSGFRNAEDFLADLKSAMTSALMRVPAPVEKTLAKSADQAAKDLEEKKHGAVVRAVKDAEKYRGYSESKLKLRELLTKAVVAGREVLATAAEQAHGGDLEAALATARPVLADFKGTELDAAAALAVKCLEKLKSAAASLEKSDKAAAKRCYAQIAKDAPESPYAALAEEKAKELGD